MDETTAAAAEAEQAFGWSILELMGHRRLAGKLQEVTIAGTAMLRIDVPGPGETWATQFYSGQAVYCITPTTETLARQVARGAQPTPVNRWELPAADEDRLADGYEVE